MTWKDASVLLATYMTYVVIFTLAPYSFELDGSLSVGEQFQERFDGLSGFGGISAWDIWTNILLYVPFGYLVATNPLMSVSLRWTHVLLAGIAAGVLSFGLEVAQVFLPRQPSIDDVVYNMAGAMMGGLLRTSMRRNTRPLPEDVTSKWRKSKATKVGIAACVVLVVAISAAPLPLAADLEAWGSEVDVDFGSDGVPQTSWRGTIYRVSVYRRELTARDVATNFLAGPFPDSRTHPVGDGLVLSYEFSARGGGFATDEQGAQLPVNFRIKDPTRARWLNPHGLALDGTGLTMFSSPPLRPTGWRFLPHQQFSVEVWIIPADPADIETVRIVSYSRSPPRERLTLTRYRREYLFRLRPANYPMPRVTSGSLENPDLQAVQQVVITHRDGAGSFYLNGVETEKRVEAVSEAFVDVILDVVGERFRWPVWSLLIFPLGVGSYLWHSSQSPLPSVKVKWLSHLTVSAILLLLVLLRFLTLSEPVEPLLMLVAGSTMLVSVIVAPSLINNFESR